MNTIMYCELVEVTTAPVVSRSRSHCSVSNSRSGARAAPASRNSGVSLMRLRT